MSSPVAATPLVVLGVSGSGKTSVGCKIADQMRRVFLDGDDLHPPANKRKMAAGFALDDRDRAPWLDAIGNRIAQETSRGIPPVVACSALKRTYRTRLIAQSPDILFIHLRGDQALLESRLKTRVHEFMPTSLLESQVATLEALGEDERGISVSVAAPIPEVVRTIINMLKGGVDSQ